MSIIKLSVTIELPGSKMMTPQECGKNPENYNDNKMLLSVKHYDKKTKKSFYRTEPLYFKTRKCHTARQTININEDAYNYMTSSMCPEWYYSEGGTNKWKKLPEITRLELHLDRICKALNGTSFTYAVFGD